MALCIVQVDRWFDRFALYRPEDLLEWAETSGQGGRVEEWRMISGPLIAAAMQWQSWREPVGLPELELLH